MGYYNVPHPGFHPKDARKQESRREAHLAPEADQRDKQAVKSLCRAARGEGNPAGGPSRAGVFTFHFEDGEMRSAVERTQRVPCAVHPQPLVNPRGGYHRGRPRGHFPLVGRGGSDESAEPSDPEHQSRDLSRGHVAGPAAVSPPRGALRRAAGQGRLGRPNPRPVRLGDNVSCSGFSVVELWRHAPQFSYAHPRGRHTMSPQCGWKRSGAIGDAFRLDLVPHCPLPSSGLPYGPRRGGDTLSSDGFS
ncbi:hypothetical protein H920_00777 [Fukomys damarensis]|uniref:Uncharacterized protein n=1 Tax=Fukomys damarensis TaxID=885580 RepID=A0A091E530_FUKDA|nr:hypothetical protein H920_00777 [Fukomys damarensis]